MTKIASSTLKMLQKLKSSKLNSYNQLKLRLLITYTKMCSILAEGAKALSMTPSGGALFAS